MFEKVKNFIGSKYFKFLLALITYLVLVNNLLIPNYNIFSFLVLIMLCIFYNKNLNKNKYFKEAFSLSLIYGFLWTFGSISLECFNDITISLARRVLTFDFVFNLIAYTTLIFSILNYLIPYFCKLKIKEFKQKKVKTIYIFILIVIGIMLLWLPYLLTFFPGTMSADSLGEFKRVIANDLKYDHHPLLHLYFIRIAYVIGMTLFKSNTMAVFTYSFLQMLIMASIFAYLIIFLYKRKTSLKLLIGIFLFYGLVPLFGYYSIVMWKDIIFSGLVLLLTIECYKMLERRKNITLKNSLIFILVSLLTVFFRNNAIYMYIILALVSIFVFKNKKNILIIFGIVIISYFTIKGPIFDLAGIKKSSSSEYLAIPMQQIGRMVSKDIKLTNYEYKTINKLMPVKTIKKVYNPQASDYIKFNKEYNQNVFNNNKLEYFGLWLNLVLKHPSVAIESYAVSTLGYWYPNTLPRTIENSIIENKLGLKTKSYVSKNVEDTINKLGGLEIPIISLTWNIALVIWLILLFSVIAVKRKGKIVLYSFVPIIGIWLTIMIATPVYNELRYIYAAFTTIPFIIGICFTKEKV